MNVQLIMEDVRIIAQTLLALLVVLVQLAINYNQIKEPVKVNIK